VLVVAPEFPPVFAGPQWTPNLQLNLVPKAAQPELQADESEWEQARWPRVRSAQALPRLELGQE
jgi:hypothetical protein